MPLIEAPVIVGLVSVLFVSVSVVALPTSVSVLVGSVSVPVLEIVEMLGEVSVLFVSVCVSVVPTTAPAGLPGHVDGAPVSARDPLPPGYS